MCGIVVVVVTEEEGCRTRYTAQHRLDATSTDTTMTAEGHVLLECAVKASFAVSDSFEDIWFTVEEYPSVVVLPGRCRGLVKPAMVHAFVRRYDGAYCCQKKNE